MLYPAKLAFNLNREIRIFQGEDDNQVYITKELKGRIHREEEEKQSQT
jgi:hypothetical protein